MTSPDVGELWFVELNERQGHEQSGNRPGVIMAVSYGMYYNTFHNPGESF